MAFYLDTTRYVMKQGWVKARKEHTCQECGAKIAKGEKYWGITMHWTTYRYGQLRFCAFCHANFERKLAKQKEKV